VSFVADFLTHYQTYESPTTFWKWAAYTGIAAAVRDNVYFKQRDMLLFPNVYTILVASSAVHRKGNPVNMVEGMLKEISATKVIAGRTSIQAILDELGHTETDKTTGKIMKGGSAIMVAPELSAGLVEDPQAIKILTDIYDLKTDFKHHLRSTGRMRIERIVFSMLAASNETLLKDVYTSAAVFGGLLGRTFIVTPNEFRRANSLMDDVDEEAHKVSRKNLLTKLKKITELAGPVLVTQDAKESYTNWYIPFRESYRNRGDKSGVAGRIHTSVLKLAIILAVNDCQLEIERRHIETAIEDCMSLIPNYNTFVMASGKSTIADAGTAVLQQLAVAGGYRLSRKVILQNNWTAFDAATLDEIVSTFEQGGIIEVVPMGTEAWYALTKKGLGILGLIKEGV